MSKYVRWLAGESEGWVARGVISREQAERIRKLYPEPGAGLPWGTIIFSGIGAVIGGLGVILLFAYNWEAMPKAAKLAVIFGTLIAAQAAGIWLFRCADWRRQLGEAVCLAGTMFFGAGIWLVAQVYHIEEHFPNGFLIWGIGALAMAWALPSLTHGILAVVVVCIWNCTEAWKFSATPHWGPLLVLAGAGALAWWQRWVLLLLVALAGFVVALAANVGETTDYLVIPVVLNVGALFVALRMLTRRHGWFAEGAPIWGFLGWLTFLLCLFLLSSKHYAGDLGDWRMDEDALPVWMLQTYRWLPLGLVLVAWAAVARDWLPRTGAARRDACPYEYCLVPLAAVMCQVFAFAEFKGLEWFVAGPFNLVCLSLAASWMARGCRDGEWRPTVLGSLLLVALTTDRYFDLFESLLSRGLVFVIVGGVLFAEGILYSRLRRRDRKEAAA